MTNTRWAGLVGKIKKRYWDAYVITTCRTPNWQLDTLPKIARENSGLKVELWSCQPKSKRWSQSKMFLHPRKVDSLRTKAKDGTFLHI